MKMYLTYICLVSLLTILLLAISNMYVAFSVYAWLITLGCNLTGVNRLHLIGQIL
ncbi:pathogenicity island protein [Staphylococcus aureus]|uniref:pathogenicity island protein n=1 Tax=Staphylococcus aureus TaxID=1280 RepID=UPI000ADAAFCE|nr:pathogenicity island protein [Staphylococcus aureus]QHK58110.1 pathogenicity island protein [Staphylococcus aureus]